MLLRPATTADIPALIDLRIALLKEVHPQATPLSAPHSPLLPHSDIAAQLAHYYRAHLGHTYINWLAIDGDTIPSSAGICFYHFAPSFQSANDMRAFILNVYTLPQYRRQGLARQLFAKLMLEATTRGITQVSLHASPDGRDLYQQFGFTARDNEMVWRAGM